ncbi:helix-turn-helix domain-containing protein [Cephaloticoccus primus]|uniref:helix-turn-helix domain-containing protein n=1 Tax=Cephaloticoccus primus TaxID=1548207 RepID=UPI0009EEF70D|nr:helix-turn-helix transcriptional regulator [Cephaloticoccus primus]
MKSPVSTPIQLKMVLRNLRRARGVSQQELGKKLGVSQRRIAAIEAAPERASFDQVARLFAALDADLLVSARTPNPDAATLDW